MTALSAAHMGKQLRNTFDALVVATCQSSQRGRGVGALIVIEVLSSLTSVIHNALYAQSTL